MTDITLMHIFGVVIPMAFFLKSYQIISGDDETVLEFLIWVAFGGVILLVTIADLIMDGAIVKGLDSELEILDFTVGFIQLFAITTVFLLLITSFLSISLIKYRKEVDRLNQQVALLEYSLEEIKRNNSSEK